MITGLSTLYVKIQLTQDIFRPLIMNTYQIPCSFNLRETHNKPKTPRPQHCPQDSPQGSTRINLARTASPPVSRALLAARSQPAQHEIPNPANWGLWYPPMQSMGSTASLIVGNHSGLDVEIALRNANIGKLTTNGYFKQHWSGFETLVARALPAHMFETGWFTVRRYDYEI